MHPITREDINELFQFNLRKNFKNLIKGYNDEDKGRHHLSWVNGKKVLMRKGKTDILVFKQIFINNEYNFKFKTAVNTIIDIGANIGLSAIYFSTRFPAARIIAIEPELSNFNLLQKNVSQYPNITPVLGGISNTSGYFKFENADVDHWAFRVEKSTEPGAGDGRMFTIEEIMKAYRMPEVDFMKIDIEGGEATLFSDNYGWMQKVKSFSIELHDFILPHSSNTFFKALCTQMPFSFTTYGENHFIEFKR